MPCVSFGTDVFVVGYGDALRGEPWSHDFQSVWDPHQGAEPPDPLLHLLREPPLQPVSQGPHGALRAAARGLR